MSSPKTVPNDTSVQDSINSITRGQKKEDSLVLLKMFSDITGKKATMWGKSIVGFGLYHYKSEKSNYEGDWPLTGFSPRKQSLTLYVMSGIDENSPLLQKLGKHKTSKACLYINKLSDVDLEILGKIIDKSFKYSEEKYGAR